MVLLWLDCVCLVHRDVTVIMVDIHHSLCVDVSVRVCVDDGWGHIMMVNVTSIPHWNHRGFSPFSCTVEWIGRSTKRGHIIPFLKAQNELTLHLRSIPFISTRILSCALSALCAGGGCPSSTASHIHSIFSLSFCPFMSFVSSSTSWRFVCDSHCNVHWICDHDVRPSRECLDCCILI